MIGKNRLVLRDGSFFIMKQIQKIGYLALATTTVLLAGCATNDEYHDDAEYSNMPWNTPQQWEGSRQIPGMSPGQ